MVHSVSSVNKNKSPRRNNTNPDFYISCISDPKTATKEICKNKFDQHPGNYQMFYVSSWILIGLGNWELGLHISQVDHNHVISFGVYLNVVSVLKQWRILRVLMKFFEVTASNLPQAFSCKVINSCFVELDAADDGKILWEHVLVFVLGVHVHT